MGNHKHIWQWWHDTEWLGKKNLRDSHRLLLKEIRAICAQLNLLEITTPLLSSHPPYEPHIQPFAVSYQEPFDNAPSQKFLRASPECAMKQYLAAHQEDIYQLAPVFRNNERSKIHYPEFTLLEFYRLHKNQDDVIKDCQTIIHHAATSLQVTAFEHHHKKISLTKKWQRQSVAQAFAHYADFDILATLDNPYEPSPHLIRKEAVRHNIYCETQDDWEVIFHRLFLALLAPHLGMDAPLVLYDYPSPLGLLARPHDQDERLAKRFEIFILGVELANGYEELRGADANRNRLALLQKKEPDPSFIEAMAHLPPVTGVALGFERLLMLLCGAQKIEDVFFIPPPLKKL